MRTRRRGATVSSVLVVAALVGVACGGDDDDGAAGERPELVIWADNSANTAAAIEPLCITLLIAVVNSFAALIMGAAAAYAFSRMRFAGRRMGLLALMLVQMFPGVLAITAVYALLRRILDVSTTFGLGSIWGLSLVYLGGALGVNTFLMKGYFDTIPVDIDESARIDGAGHARIFFGLILRLATPILVVVFFVSFQSTFNELPLAQVVLPDTQDTTLAVGLNGLVANPLIQEWGLMAAGGVMAAIPLFAVFLLTSRSLVTGLTAGAVKG